MTIVVTRLIGGLGNQFFQYTAGRALALRYNAALKLDVSGFESYPLRRYELVKYPIEATIATPEELAMFGGDPDTGRVVQFVNAATGRSGQKPGYTRYREPHFHFDPALFGAAPPVHLLGYWVTDRYFRHIADRIRRELTPKEPLNDDNRRALARIQSTFSVAVHIRRGDYVSNPVTTAYHGLLPLGYYRRAMDYIAERVSDPVFFVFSDDIGWVKDNLRHPVAMEMMSINRADQGHRDLQLMTACRHHILANSTFSWWGAWMSESAAKIVIAPTPWFLNMSLDTRDLLPGGWTAMEAYDPPLRAG